MGGTENAVAIIHLFVLPYTCDQAVILCSSLGTDGLLESSFCKRARRCYLILLLDPQDLYILNLYFIPTASINPHM